jgi:VanZ family protein
MQCRTMVHLSRAATLIVAGVIGVMALYPDAPMPSGHSHADKLLHVLAFAAFIFPSALLDPRSTRHVFPSGLALGAAIEILQPHVGRHGSFADLVADAVGLCLGLAAGLALHSIMRRMPRNRSR